MTSILRTYYSFQVSKSSDKTYNLQLMGLWAWAELAIGIIVGCLPVMPRFFQHIGPKVYQTLSFGFKNEISPAHGLKDAHKKAKANAFTKIQRPFATYIRPSVSRSLTDTYSPETQFHDDCLTLDKLESSLPQVFIAHETVHPPGVIIATRRNDLDYGQNML